MLSQNCPDAITSSTSTKPTKPAFSYSVAVDDLITANAATMTTARAMNSSTL